MFRYMQEFLFLNDGDDGDNDVVDDDEALKKILLKFR